MKAWMSLMLFLLAILTVVALSRGTRRDRDEMESLREFLLEDGRMVGSTQKPILWIHVPRETNDRRWLSFGTRNSTYLNQEYLHATMHSIVRHCRETFEIVLIDDTTFGHLLPEWTISVPTLPDPMRTHTRHLAMAKLLHRFGGTLLPMSFLCFADLSEMVQRYGARGMFVGETRSAGADAAPFAASPMLMGCPKACPQMQAYAQFLERLCSVDCTDEWRFAQKCEAWCAREIRRGRVQLVPGTDLGTSTVARKPITLDDLFSDDIASTNLYPSMVGLWIPAQEILHRRAYEWFARDRHYAEHGFLLSRLLAAGSLAPILSNVKQVDHERAERVDALVGFWKIPDSGTVVYGLPPIGVGRVVRE